MGSGDLLTKNRSAEIVVRLVLAISALSVVSYPFIPQEPNDLLLSILRVWGDALHRFTFFAVSVAIVLTWAALSSRGPLQALTVFVASVVGVNLLLSPVSLSSSLFVGLTRMLGSVTSFVVGVGLIAYSLVVTFGLTRIRRYVELTWLFILDGIGGVAEVVRTLLSNILSSLYSAVLNLFGRSKSGEVLPTTYVKRHSDTESVSVVESYRYLDKKVRSDNKDSQAGNKRRSFDELFKVFNRNDSGLQPVETRVNFSESNSNKITGSEDDPSEILGIGTVDPQERISSKIVRFSTNKAKRNGSYKRPNLAIFVPRDKDQKVDKAHLDALAEKIEESLKEFNVTGKIKEVHPGPVVTTFEFEPAPGIKVGKVATLQDDLAMSLKAHSIRIVAPIPKKGTIGIEVPNRTRYVVRLRTVLESQTFQQAPDLALCLGEDTVGEPVVVDLAAMPHLLIAGATGTGKSVCINSLLISLLYKNSPENLGLILIDPKVLELSIYDGLPHLKAPVITEAKKAKAVLQWAVGEMERRYKFLQKFGVRNIDSFNSLPEKDAETLSKLVIIIDELADLMFSVGKEIEELIIRLAQKARAAGIHLIMATQRPSVDVVTGLIKANFPARISFRVVTRVDSRTILDQMGAEKLLGKGDMLVMLPGGLGLKRVHGAFVSDEEVQRFVNEVKLNGPPSYDPEILELLEAAERQEASVAIEVDEGSDEELYRKALEIIVQKGQASTSMIQRALRIGYNRAARIIEKMEQEGFLGASDGVRPREVLYQNIKKVYPNL